MASASEPPSSPPYALRMLTALESLLATPASSLQGALSHAAQHVAQMMGAEKVDAFLYRTEEDTLEAVGTSDTPLARKQVALGLHRLPSSNGGQAVRVFRSGKPLLDGHVERDPEEVPGIKEKLGVRSHVAAPLEVEGRVRGVLSVTTTKPEAFGPEDLAFVQAASRWVGMVARQAELVEQLTREAAERGRRTAAEELITTLAHDMNALIGALSGRIDLLDHRAGREQHLANMRDASQARLALERLRRLIADLLDVGRLEQGIFTLERRATDLMVMVREVASLAAEPEHPVVVRGEEELVALVDPRRVRQALENLVGNALKHSPAQVPVQVQVLSQQREGGPWALVCVQDQGPGIAPELLPHLFERFAAGPQSTGLGLGLYLAHRIAAAHGGSLQVESVPGKGARFELSLPLGNV
ncbi:GAF domain-containing sensor histidine kinase [Aggregicoccus sp. 17bor-14]|uniref:GAF domain-containing sensor histidine kinase n=1 Tax=Myxococcaceae TaxID=31 RepID=UPI00129C136E|nr:MULTISPECIES: GAF domain-containing sensor histidine kinase [Myxococcaceae]MBF5045962.1 GAF domain-containing sensor histidine kinase [Simulacricoccus sp. 17bor-14]MRI91694.1 GAF domain-containing sensor histidine kinase [Aggregicoccus sp. 17bor-14]